MSNMDTAVSRNGLLTVVCMRSARRPSENSGRTARIDDRRRAHPGPANNPPGDATKKESPDESRLWAEEWRVSCGSFFLTGCRKLQCGENSCKIFSPLIQLVYIENIEHLLIRIVIRFLTLLAV